MLKINLENIAFVLTLLIPFAIILGQAPSDILVSSISILFIINSFIHKDWSWTRIKWVKIIFFVWVYLIFASFFALDKTIGISHSILFVRFFLFAIALQYWVLSRPNYLKTLLYLLTISFGLVLFDTLIQFLNFDPVKGYGPDLLGFYSNDHFRLTGPFRSNIPGAYLSKYFYVVLCFILFLTTNLKLKMKEWIIVPIISLVFFVVFATGEAMSFASMGLGLVIFFFLTKKYKKKLIVCVPIVSILIFLIIKYNPVWQKIEILENNAWHNGTVYEIEIPCENNESQKCKKTFETQPFFTDVLKNFSETAYAETYKQSIIIWKDYPLTGIGIKNYTKACKLDKYRKNIKYFFCTTHPHNFYIQWLLETGILGLIGFLILLSYWFKHFLIKIKRENIKVLFFSPIITLCIIFWPIMSTGSFFSNRNASMNWFIIGVCLAINSLRKKKISFF